MIIATYNVNDINARLPVLLRWLSEEKPDVACLQELKAPNEKFPEQALLDAGYDAVWHGQKSWNGVAIIAKKKFHMTEAGLGLPGDATDDQSRYIQAMVKGILIVCIYLPNGNPAPGPTFAYKMEWFNRLLGKAWRLVCLKSPVILTGDFNVAPAELDTASPQSWLNDPVISPESRAAFEHLLHQGWTDAIRTLYPDQKIFTYWDDLSNAFDLDEGIRIDHLLLNPYVKTRLKKGGVHRYVRGWEETSDHAPVWIEISDVRH